MLGEGLGIVVWVLFFSFEADSIRREEIVSGLSPCKGFLLARSLILVSIVFIFFSLDNCLMKRYNKET